MDDQTLMTLTSLGIDAKMTCLKSDAYERTSGMLFEYGHTLSHAIEKAYGDGVIPHGLGVTYGMLSSSYVLLHKIGEPVPTKTNNLSKFPCKHIRKWLYDMGFPQDDTCKAEPMYHEAALPEKDSTVLVDLDSSDDEQLGSTRHPR